MSGRYETGAIRKRRQSWFFVSVPCVVWLKTATGFVTLTDLTRRTASHARTSEGGTTAKFDDRLDEIIYCLSSYASPFLMDEGLWYRGDSFKATLKCPPLMTFT